MIDQSVRFEVKIPSVETAADKLDSFWDLVKGNFPDAHILRRFKRATIQGKFYTGKARGALLVGDTKEAQIEFVDATEDYIINGVQDLQKLVVVSNNKETLQAVVVMQF